MPVESRLFKGILSGFALCAAIIYTINTASFYYMGKLMPTKEYSIGIIEYGKIHYISVSQDNLMHQIGGISGIIFILIAVFAIYKNKH